MNINSHNYEAFFLDYHEGNLSPQQVADLLLFLEQHPGLKQDFDSFENIRLDNDAGFSFENKAGLKKSITPDNKEDYFIKAAEQDLNQTERGLLQKFLEQHPQYQHDYTLFQKTILVPDKDLIFENKQDLKQLENTTDALLIAAVEGLLTPQENTLLNRQLMVDAALRHDFELYRETKLAVEHSLVFENKEHLKRRERKIIPLYYYAAGIAAALLFLFGLFFLFTNHSDKTEFADGHKLNKEVMQVHPAAENQNKGPANSTAGATENKTNTHPVYGTSGTNKKKAGNELNETEVAKTDSSVTTPDSQTNNKPLPEIGTPELAHNEQNNPSGQLAANGNPPLVKQPNQTAGNALSKGNEYLSLRELAVEKLKQKTLDEASLEAQKKSGRDKRFNGWDFAQIVTRGVSKLIGKNVELKPSYNNDGDVVAYALGNGVEISRGR